MIDLNQGGWRPADDLRAPPIGERINSLIDAALVSNAEPRRTYIGASMVGQSCERRVQLEYSGTPVDPDKEFTGKTRRIFALGHILEELTLSWLRLAGFEILNKDSTGEQFGFADLEGVFSGHIDGVIVRTPAGLGVPALWEHKGLNEKNWQDVTKKGLRASKPVYSGQIALYQGYMGLHEHPALFTAINKNTCELYHELIPFDGTLAQRMIDRAARIYGATRAGELLPREFHSADWYECKFCPFQRRCWQVLH
jgi:hypothetical protein